MTKKSHKSKVWNDFGEIKMTRESAGEHDAAIVQAAKELFCLKKNQSFWIFWFAERRCRFVRIFKSADDVIDGLIRRLKNANELDGELSKEVSREQ